MTMLLRASSNFLRRISVALAFALVFTVTAQASTLIYLDDIDDFRVFKPLEKNEAVEKQRKELDGLREVLLKLDRAEIDKLLGPTDKKPAKAYAMPLSEQRTVVIGGMRAAGDNRPDSDFVSFHPLGDLAAVEIYYSRSENGNKPFAVRFYLKADDQLPKLTPDKLGADAISERLAWEEKGLKKLAEAIRGKDQPK